MDTLTSDNFTLHPELKRLLRALELCEGFGLYFARCNTVSLRNELVATLKANLAKPIIELSLNIENDIFIDAQMAQLLGNASDDTVVFIYDLEKLFYLKDRHIIQELNWRRGEYGRLNHPVVFWLPEFLVSEIFNEAPDFSDWYSGIYEFSFPKSEKINLITNTWQIVSENFFAQLSITEKKRWNNNLQYLLIRISKQEDSKAKSDLLNRLGHLYYSLGYEYYRMALSNFLKSLVIQKKIRDQRGEAATRNNIAQIYKFQSDCGIAAEYLEKALGIMREIGDKKGEGKTYHNMGSNEVAKGNYGIALDYLEKSRRIRHEIGDKKGECETLNSIARIYNSESHYETALDYLEKSLKIQQEIDDKPLDNISKAHKVENDNDASLRYIAGAVKGDDDDVLKYLNQSLKIMQKISDKKVEGDTLNIFAQIYDVQGNHDDALLHLNKSLKISQNIGDKQGEGATLNNISQVYDAKGDYDTALAYLTQALKIQQDIGDKQGEGATLNNISQIYDAKGDYDTALLYLKDSLKIRQDIGNEAGECSTLFNIGNIYWQSDEKQKAKLILLKAYNIAKKIGYKEALETLDKLGGLALWENLSLANSESSK